MFKRSFDQIVAPLQGMVRDLQKLRDNNDQRLTENDSAIERIRQNSIEVTQESLKAQAVQQKIEALVS